jgi:hypothetical protein
MKMYCCIGDNPGLPDNFDRLHVSFSLPTPKELLCHLYSVCARGLSSFLPQYIKEKLSKFINMVCIIPMTYRFVLEKEPASILFYWRSLYNHVMETSGKPLCIFSSGCRVKYLKKVTHNIQLFSLSDT